MLPEDDRMIETCRSVLSVLMWILDFLNNIYIYVCVCVVCVCGVCVCVWCVCVVCVWCVWCVCGVYVVCVVCVCV